MGFSYFSDMPSVSAFNRCPNNHENPISGLKSAAASDWGRDHLFACRVIRRKTLHYVLPVLSDFVRSSDLKSPPEIKAFVDGPFDPLYMAQSEHQLVRSSGQVLSLGQIWAALATFKGSHERRREDLSLSATSDNEPEERGPREKRARRNTLQEDFVDSRTVKTGSSSPLGSSQGRTAETGSSSPRESSQVSSISYIDAQSHGLLAAPEDETLRLASCVFRHILYFGAPQKSVNLSTVVEFRDAKARLAASTQQLQQKIIAIDDGGLCLREKNSNGRFELTKNFLAILECKKQFQCFEDGRPVISDQ